MVRRSNPSRTSKRGTTLVRQLTPGIVATVYYYSKHRCIVHPRAMVQLSRDIEFGRKTTVHQYSRIILSPGGQVFLGAHCNVQSFTTIAAGDSRILIGDHVRIGPNSNLLGQDHDYRDREVPIHLQPRISKGLTLGDDVWIGANCVLLPGVEIGNGSIIGAGSVVTKNVPPFSVVVGNPARVIKSR